MPMNSARQRRRPPTTPFLADSIVKRIKSKSGSQAKWRFVRKPISVEKYHAAYELLIATKMSRRIYQSCTGRALDVHGIYDKSKRASIQKTMQILNNAQINGKQAPIIQALKNYEHQFTSQTEAYHFYTYVTNLVSANVERLKD